MTDTTPTPRAERVTHFLVRDVALPDGLGTLALVTLHNPLDPTKPTPPGPQGIAALQAAVERLHERATDGEIVAVGVTGKPYFLAAGADLTQVASVTSREDA